MRIRIRARCGPRHPRSDERLPVGWLPNRLDRIEGLCGLAECPTNGETESLVRRTKKRAGIVRGCEDQSESQVAVQPLLSRAAQAVAGSVGQQPHPPIREGSRPLRQLDDRIRADRMIEDPEQYTAWRKRSRPGAMPSGRECSLGKRRAVVRRLGRPEHRRHAPPKSIPGIKNDSVRLPCGKVGYITGEGKWISQCHGMRDRLTGSRYGPFSVSKYTIGSGGQCARAKLTAPPQAPFSNSLRDVGKLLQGLTAARQGLGHLLGRRDVRTPRPGSATAIP